MVQTLDYNYEKRMVQAALRGDEDTVREMLSLGFRNLNETLGAAAYAGHLNIVKLLLNPFDLPKDHYYHGGAKDIDFGILCAAEGGYMFIIDYLKSQRTGFTSCHKKPATYAAHGGHLYIVQNLLGEHPYEHNEAVVWAAYGGHEQVVNYLLSKGKITNYDELLAAAAEGGLEGVVKRAIELGATDISSALQKAARGGHISIIKMLLELGATKEESYWYATINAAESLSVDVLKLLLPLSPKKIISYTTENIYEEIIKGAICGGGSTVENDKYNTWGSHELYNYFPGYNPTKVRDQTKIKEIVLYALKEGDGTLNWDNHPLKWASYTAAKKGYLEIVKILLAPQHYLPIKGHNKGFMSAGCMTSNALEGGDMKTIEFLLFLYEYESVYSKDAQPDTISESISSFNKELKGSMNWYASNAIQHGRTQAYFFLHDLIQRKGIKAEYQYHANIAASNGNLDILKLLISTTTLNIEELLIRAADKCKVESVQFLLQVSQHRNKYKVVFIKAKYWGSYPLYLLVKDHIPEELQEKSLVWWVDNM